MRRKAFNHWELLDYGFAEIAMDIRGMIVFHQMVCFLGTLATPRGSLAGEAVTSLVNSEVSHGRNADQYSKQ